MDLQMRAYPLFRGLVKVWNPNFSASSVAESAAETIETLVKWHSVMLTPELEYKVCISAFAGHRTVALWLENGRDVPLQKTVEIMCTFIPQDIRAILDSCKTRNFSVDKKRQLELLEWEIALQDIG
ncbi:MAG: hypothetical protein LBK67_08380 [Coriobacteriales bacterium]|nr:hypothetical protein [Coriobacteriales bacterium]